MRMDVSNLKTYEVGRIINENIPLGILPHLFIEVKNGVFIGTEGD